MTHLSVHFYVFTNTVKENEDKKIWNDDQAEWIRSTLYTLLYSLHKTTIA